MVAALVGAPNTSKSAISDRIVTPLYPNRLPDPECDPHLSTPAGHVGWYWPCARLMGVAYNTVRRWMVVDDRQPRNETIVKLMAEARKRRRRAVAAGGEPGACAGRRRSEWWPITNTMSRIIGSQWEIDLWSEQCRTPFAHI